METLKEAEPTSPRLLERAAVRGVFDPRKLIAPSSPQAEIDLAYLAKRSTEKLVGSRWLWTLDLAARQEGLRRLPKGQAARTRFLSENELEPEDRFGRMLHLALGMNNASSPRNVDPGKSPGGSSSLSVEEQVGLFQAVATLVDAGAPARNWVSDNTARKLRRSIVVTEQRRAAKTLLPDAFRGRSLELRFLAEFATAGALPTVARSGVKISPAPTPGGSDALRTVVVTGIGGIGKSALLEQLRRNLTRDTRATVISLDFDSPSLRRGDPLAMALEVARQIGLVEPKLDAQLSASRQSLRQAAGSEADPGSYERASSALLGELTAWKGLFANTSFRKRPLVIILDTFEEVLTASVARVQTIARWAGNLQEIAGFERVVLIVSGRAVEKIKMLSGSELRIGAAIELRDLGTRSGEAKLADAFRRFGVNHIGLVKDLVATFGSNPLVLEVLARYCRDKRVGEIRQLVAEGKAEGASGLTGELAQRFLYSRNLERIRDEDVRKLARPGLVLRRVTAELIETVLAEPCGLKDMTKDVAVALLDRLKQYAWLVDSSGPEEAVHRRDLRSLMLPQLLHDKGGRTVARLAGEWFAGRGQPGDDLEAIYYRALAGVLSPAPDEKRLRALADHLGSDTADLPLRLRARVKLAAQRTLTGSEIEALPADLRLRYRDAAQGVLVNEGLESAVRPRGAPRPAGAVMKAVPRGRLTAASTTASFDGSRIADARVWEEQVARRSEAISSFATGNVSRLTAEAVPMFRHCLRQVLQGSDGDKQTLVEHPAYLAFVACLGEGLRASHDVRAVLKSTASDPAIANDLAHAVQSRLGNAAEGSGHVALLLLLTHLAGVDLNLIPGFADAPLKDGVRRVETISAWRCALLIGNYGKLGKSSVRASLLPLFAREAATVQSGLGGERTIGAFGWDRVRLPPLLLELHEALRRPDRESLPVSLSDLNGIEAELSRATVPVHFPVPAGHLERLLSVGRTPELSGAIRSALLTGSPRQLPALVAAVMPHAGWPRELSPERFQSGTAERLVPSLVDIADRFGLLETLLMTAAGRPRPGANVRRVHRMYASFAARWARLPRAPEHAAPRTSSTVRSRSIK